jgi:hypothetical protein
MSVRVHPSFARAAASVLALMILGTAVAYLWQGYREHSWWSHNYFVSLVIPFTIVPVIVCVAWVPSQFEFNDTHLTIRFPFRPLRIVPWDDLQYYGWLEGVYGLQFRNAGTFSLLPQALPKREWRMFKRFLYTTFPDRKASGFIGARFYQWPRKKKKT